jgi:hypothetical protein
MDFLYVFVVRGAEWEDIVIYRTEEEAIEQSKRYPRARLEVFRKSGEGGYEPTYNYYSNGELVTTH